MRKTLLAALVLAVAVSVVAQQPPDTAPQKAAMKKLEMLVGEYDGSGSMNQGPSTHTFNSHERISMELNGLVLEIHGDHTSTDGGAGFKALGVVFYDTAKKAYRFRSWTTMGQTAEFAFDFVGDRKIVWGNDQMRYTIDLSNAGTWNETGEYTMDGKNWTKFFQMTLRKK
jgi:hypothetical protein